MKKGTILLLLAISAQIVVRAGILYSNDFTGATGDRPSGSSVVGGGLECSVYKARLDGEGHLVPSESHACSSFRVRLGVDSVQGSDLQLTATLKTPESGDNGWVGIGFLEDGSGNKAGFAAPGANSGPWLQFSSGGVRIRGGHGSAGSETLYRVANLTYRAGDVATVAMTFHTVSQTVDLVVNGAVVVKDCPITHVPGKPVAQWAEIQFFNEAPAGAYIDQLVVETPGSGVATEDDAVALPQRDPNTVWIDAAAFQQTGGWLLDTQFIHLMGAPYLIAAGAGTPVQDAQAVFEITEPGSYRIWVRSRNWMKEFSPGQFQLSMDGKRQDAVFGRAESDQWLWEPVGSVALQRGKHTVGLADLTGYYGRCAAIILSKDAQYVPPDDFKAFLDERARLTGVSREPVDLGEYDVVVVGGGASGCPAALASARTGARTALVQDRPVLGGNASVELGVPVMGAALYQSYARESGICEEVGRIKAHGGYPKLSKAFAQVVAAETNLTAFMNLHVYGVVMEGNRIVAVKARDSLTGAERMLRAKQFVDTTGDGWLGYYAGADYRVGREAASEYNESLAPEKADNRTMSGCLMGNLKLGYGWEKTDSPAPYAPPPWAYKLPPNPEFGRSVDSPNGQWWLEYPNDMDDLWHAEEARDELLRIIFGYWDFIKNKWQYKYSVENAALTYVPVTEAKRESRRLLGDHVLTQNDVLAARAFPDTIGHAGWSMDIHHPEGILSGRGGPYDFDRFAPQSNIPFSSLYSRNIENLLFAGRCISVTHVALGTVRVEGSCAVTGQAVGTAAAMCAAKNTTPRELDARYIGELQQQLLKDDQYVPGIRNQDADDLALHASVSASSVAAGDQTDQAFVLPDRSGRSLGMYTLYGLVYPTGSDGRIGDLYLRVFSSLEKEVSLPIKIRAVENNRVTDVAACPVLQEATVRVPELHDGYVKFSLQCAVPSPFFMVEINASPGLFLPWAKKGHLGTRLVWERNGISNIGRPAVMMYTDPPLQYPNDYSAANVIGGISRIEDAESNMWRSDPSAPLPQWLALKWDAPQKISSIHLTFDTDLDVWNHDEAMPPETVKAYDVQVNTPDGWKTVVSEANNFQRFRKHTIEPVMTDQLRVVVNRTGGDPSARIYEIRVY